MLWANTQVAHFLSVQRATATVEDGQTVEKSSLSEYDKVVVTKNVETIDTFSSHVIPIKAEKAYTRERISMMTQALRVKNGSLPQGLTVQNVYTELRTDSKNTVVVVRNSTAYPQTLKKKNPGSLSGGCHCSSRAASDDWLAGRGGRASQSTSP